MKKIIIVTLVLVVAFIVYKLVSNPLQETIVNNVLYSSNQGVKEAEVSSVSEAEIYIDASGSMKGYFLSDKPDFINTISSLTGFADSGKIYFAGNPKQYKGLVKDIVQDLRKQPNNTATTFHKSFEEMCKKSTGNKVCFLVTDGIMSVGKKTNLALKDLQYAVEKTLKNFGSDKGVAVLRYTSEFMSDSGKDIYYYDSNDTRHVLNCPNRPYFVIVIGSKDVVRYIRKAAAEKLNTPEAIYFGVHDMSGHIKNNCTTSDAAILEFPNDPIVVNATLPTCFTTIDTEYIKSHLSVSINGTPIADKYKKESGTRINNQELNIVLNPIDYIISPDAEGKVTISIFITNELPSEWVLFSSNDDRKIEKLDTERTFGLSTLLQGFKNSMDTEKKLIEFTYKFTL